MERKYLTEWKRFLAEQKSMADPYRGAIEKYRDTVLSLLDKFDSTETSSSIMKFEPYFEKHIDDILNDMSETTLSNYLKNMSSWQWNNISTPGRLMPRKLKPTFDNNQTIGKIYSAMWEKVRQLLSRIMSSELNAPPVDDSGAVKKSNNSENAMKIAQELQTACDAFVTEVDKALNTISRG